MGLGTQGRGDVMSFEYETVTLNVPISGGELLVRGVRGWQMSGCLMGSEPGPYFGVGVQMPDRITYIYYFMRQLPKDSYEEPEG